MSSIYQSSYLGLPNDFYEAVPPRAISNPYWVYFNQELASFLCLTKEEQEDIDLYAGNRVPPHLQTIALAYSGHQFGYYVPLLGDGRALMLGEITDKNNMRWDIQLKGSGKTRFSRMGDGRAPLSAVLREYLISEAMHGLNIPSTRCLAAVASEEQILRQNGPVPLGILTRIASSSLRVGSFEYAASQRDAQALKSLAHYALTRHYPDRAEREHPYLELFKAVADNQARLIADWMGVGFIHGVMNTDNMSISGETIDYGPCAFMDEFDFGTVFSSIDIGGRYAFGNQASIAQWNLSVFYHALAPLFQNGNQDTGQNMEEALHLFSDRFQFYWNKKIKEKLGLPDEHEKIPELIKNFFMLMQQYKPDYTNTFRLMSQSIDSERHQQHLITVLGNQEQSRQWVSDWLHCLQQSNSEPKNIRIKMNQVNPAYIPRNHLVEQAIQNYIENKDRTLMDTLLDVMKKPYHQQKNTTQLQNLPKPDERVCQTFCGT